MNKESHTQNSLPEDQNHINQVEHQTPYQNENEETPFCDLYFPFKIEQEHRLSEQAVVLAGISIQHNRKAVLKQFDLGLESKAFKKELEVLAKIKLSDASEN